MAFVCPDVLMSLDEQGKTESSFSQNIASFSTVTCAHWLHVVFYYLSGAFVSRIHLLRILGISSDPIYHTSLSHWLVTLSNSATRLILNQCIYTNSVFLTNILSVWERMKSESCPICAYQKLHWYTTARSQLSELAQIWGLFFRCRSGWVHNAALDSGFVTMYKAFELKICYRQLSEQVFMSP